jgi:hypothetical protein
MSKTKTIQKLNTKIDQLIINGRTRTEEYKRLTKLHYKLIKAL